MSGLVIGIDYDGTITADPAFWFGFATLARKHGHQVVVVTGRIEPPPVGTLPVVCCGNEYKRRAAERAGWAVDIWIDDEPGHIEPGRKLAW